MCLFHFVAVGDAARNVREQTSTQTRAVLYTAVLCTEYGGTVCGRILTAVAGSSSKQPT